jgi:uracil-DNA glycosylase
LGIDKGTFYDREIVAIVPMGFCYPGKGKTGDLPPRVECAVTWRKKLLALIDDAELVIVIGIYAQNWHMENTQKKNLTETVKNWREYWPTLLPLPHPSPRNNIWLAKNLWFEKEVIPNLQNRVQAILAK